MGDVQSGLVLKLGAAIVLASAGTLFTFLANKSVNRIFNVHYTVVTKSWLIAFVISSLTNVSIFIVFTIMYVINSNVHGRELSDTEVGGVISIGLVSPLISSIFCIFVQPQDKQKAFIVGVASFFATFIYLSIMLYLYVFAFKGISNITGL